MKVASFGVLNIVSHPHPAGTYRRLFELAGKMVGGINFRGDQYARLSPVSETRNGVFTGRIAIWTEIDKNSKTIEKRTLIEAALADTNARIPDDIGFNSKIFSFALREKDHRMYVELSNDEGQSVSISSVQKIVQGVMDNVKPDNIEDVNIFVVSKHNAVEQILAIDQLTKIEIVLDMPNPDDLGDDKKRILKELEDMKAKRLKSEITKARREETLLLLPRYRVMAELAKDNGYVHATGKENGVRIERSTKDYPEEIEIELLADESSALATRRVAESPRDHQ